MGAEGRTLYPHCKQFLHWRKNVKCERPNLAKCLSIYLTVMTRKGTKCLKHSEIDGGIIGLEQL